MTKLAATGERVGKAYRYQRWVILGLGWAAQAATCTFLYGIASLVPAFRDEDHLSLAHAELLVAAPSLGLFCTLIAWGAAADRFGERRVIAIGLALAGVIVLLSARAGTSDAHFVLFVAAGAASASVNAASGRVVMGWFNAAERGLAMGVRQTAQPLGVGLGAVVLPWLARGGDISRALLFNGSLCILMAALVAVLVVDPPRPEHATSARQRSPYRQATLWRLHAASTLLVVPQFAVSAFAFTFLIEVRHWSAVPAGRVILIGQCVGAAGRIGAGWWSDRVGSRLRPMRQIAVLSACVMAAIAVTDAAGSAFVIVAFLVGAVITVADNGLGFTSTAELAGQQWAGRSLGVQNTAQNIASMLTPPVLGWFIATHSYVTGFALVAVFPLLAIACTPVRSAAQAGHP